MIVLYIFLALIIYIAISAIPGYLSKKLHEQKGYIGGFWVGFFFGIMGLIYAAGLPDRKKSKIITNDKGETIIDNDNNEISDFIDICPNCGSKIFPDERVCYNCGYKINDDNK